MTDIAICPICTGNAFEYFLTCIDHTVSKETFNLQRCKNCCLILTTPRPENQKLGNYYLSDDYISHSNKGKSLTDQLYLLARNYTLRWKLSLIEKYRSPNSKRELLDYGCGTATFLSYCQNKDWNVSGVEPSEQARINSDPQIRQHIQPTLTDLNDKKFHVITLWHVLEHIPDLSSVIQQLKDRLTDDGVILIAVPNPYSFDAQLYKQYWAGYDVPRHLWHFSKSNIRELTKNNLLNVVQILPMKLDSFYVSLLSQRYINPTRKIQNYVLGFINGLRSNINARQTSEYSSLIYVVKKL